MVVCPSTAHYCQPEPRPLSPASRSKPCCPNSMAREAAAISAGPVLELTRHHHSLPSTFDGWRLMMADG